MTAGLFPPLPPLPLLDLELLCVPYYPTWDVLYRMRASELPRCPVETVVDMGAFYDDDDDDEFDDDLKVQCRLPGRALVFYCLGCVLLLAFMLHFGRRHRQIRFVRDRV